MKINKNKIEELVKILDELNLTELSYSDGKESIKVAKAQQYPVQTFHNQTHLQIRRFHLHQNPLMGSKVQWSELHI